MKEAPNIKWLKSELSKLTPDNDHDAALIDLIEEIIDDVKAMGAIRKCMRGRLEQWG